MENPIAVLDKKGDERIESKMKNLTFSLMGDS